MCPEFVCIMDRVPTKLSQGAQCFFARWVPDDSKELNEFGSNSSKAPTCNSIPSQASSTNQNLTPACSYPLFMSPYVGGQAPHPLSWAGLWHLQVHKCFRCCHSSPREQQRETTRHNLIRHCNSCLPYIAFSPGGKWPGGQLVTMPPTDPPWGPHRILVFWNC